MLLLLVLLWGCNKKPNDQPSDQLLSQQVQDQFFQDPALKNLDIQVQSTNGAVTLTGLVDEESERASAGRIASQVPGVKQVVLSLTIAEPAPREVAPKPEESTSAQALVHAPEHTAASGPAQSLVDTAENDAPTSSAPTSQPRHNSTASTTPVSPRNNTPHSSSPYPAPVLPTNSASTAPATPASLITKSWTDPIDRYLARKPNPTRPSPLTGSGTVFESDGKQYTIDPRLIVGISGAETSFATGKCHSTLVSTTRNAWNWFYCYGSNSCGTDVCGNSPFDSWESGINTVSKYVERNYVMKGLTDVRKIQTKYCTSGCDNWVPNVESVMKEMGGDPEHLTLTSQTH